MILPGAKKRKYKIVDYCDDNLYDENIVLPTDIVPIKEREMHTIESHQSYYDMFPAAHILLTGLNQEFF